MNPWVILSALVALIVVGAGGARLGYNYATGKAAREEVLIQTASEAAQQAAAKEIAKIKIVHQTNQTRLEREIVHVPDFSNCHAGDAAKRVLDDALANKTSAESAGGLELPELTPLADDSFGTIAKKLAEVAGLYYECREAALAGQTK